MRLPCRGYVGVTGTGLRSPTAVWGAVCWCLNQHWEYSPAAAGAEHWGLHSPCSAPLSNRPEQGWEQRDRPGAVGQRGVPLLMMLMLQNKSSGKGGRREDVLVVFAFPRESYSL